MKKYRFYGGLLIIPFLILIGCSFLTTNVKNIKDYSSPVEQANHTQAVITAVQSISDDKSNPFIRFLKKCKIKIMGILGLLWLCMLDRFYKMEKGRRIPRWKLDDIARLHAIRLNAIRLWDNHRPDRKIIRLEDWKQDT